MIDDNDHLAQIVTHRTGVKLPLIDGCPSDAAGVAPCDFDDAQSRDIFLFLAIFPVIEVLMNVNTADKPWECGLGGCVDHTDPHHYHSPLLGSVAGVTADGNI
jgi:hypothetical protein